MKKIILLGLLIFLISCQNSNEKIHNNFSKEPIKKIIIQKKDPYSLYIDAIKINNNDLRLESTKTISECYSGDKECQLVSIYEYFLQNYKYFNDARDDEHIQTPFETKKYKGGDCEDLSILLNSLLENIGIETWMVFTKDHAYSLACGVDPEILYNYTILLFDITDLVENSTLGIDLEPEEASYYRVNSFENYSLFISGSIDANRPVIIFAVEDEKEFQAFMNDEEYGIIEGSYYENIKRKNFEYMISNGGGIVIYNPHYYQGISLDLNLKVYINYLGIDIKDIKIKTYEFNNKTCVPLDPSTGEMSYVGYEDNDDQEKIFVNTITREKRYI